MTEHQIDPPVQRLDSSVHGLHSARMLSIIAGAGGAMWFTVCMPQAIFSIFFKNHLGATASQLGLLVSLFQLAGVMNLAAPFLFSLFRRRKPVWAVSHMVQRTISLVPAGVAFAVAAGGEPVVAADVVLISTAVSMAITHLTNSGWWSWMADIFPEKTRAGFFTRRSATINAVNTVWIFVVSVVVQPQEKVSVFLLYGVVFSVSGFFGIVDVVLHMFIPEPEVRGGLTMTWRTFTLPVLDQRFRRLMITIGLTHFSITLFSPFIAPFVTDPGEVGAPTVWIGLMFVVTSISSVTSGPLWGHLMDRYGRRAFVSIGALFTFSWIGYLFISPNNYAVILLAVALLSGLLSPAFWDGSAQLMLTLAPREGRTAYVAWYLTVISLFAAGGAITGGRLLDALHNLDWTVGDLVRVEAFDVVLLVAIGLVLCSVAALRTVREEDARTLSFVIGRVVRPATVRVLAARRTLIKSTNPTRVLRALRRISGPTADIAVDEVWSRLDDPEPEIRDEAALAIHRIREAESE